MEVRIIKVGNSKGLRLSKTILERYDIGDKVELIMKEDHIQLIPIPHPRKGWAAKFQQMHKFEDDNLLIDDVFDDEVFE